LIDFFLLEFLLMSSQKTREAAYSPCPVCLSTNAVRLYSKPRQDRTWHLARCSDCLQHYTDPLPTLDDIKSFYSDEYHADLTSEQGSEGEFGKKFRGYADWILQHVPPGRSLDIGCTTGLFPYILKQRGFQSEGLEINTVTAQWGQEHYNIPIRNQPFETTTYDERAFRLISMADVLEHSLNPAATLNRVYSILEDDGFLFVSFPDIESIESRYFRALALATRRDWLWGCCHIPLHTWEFTRPTAENMFRNAGFNIVAFRRSHLNTFESSSSPLLNMLSAPPLLLQFPPLGRKLGTQMEFILRKSHKPAD
jgi:2-polyprenyl-3-methyl-5-hydroxy-6-metoxy-1,4-benzoquinol methylase